MHYERRRRSRRRENAHCHHHTVCVQLWLLSGKSDSFEHKIISNLVITLLVFVNLRSTIHWIASFSGSYDFLDRKTFAHDGFVLLFKSRRQSQTANYHHFQGDEALVESK